MGRKGVSKRKPKKTNSGSNDNINHGSSNRRPGESPSVQLLVKEKGVPFNRSDANPGSNNKNRKGK
jgi:hypothetical protein